MIKQPFLIAAALLAPVLVFGAGYFSGMRNQRVEIKTEYKDKIVYQDRVVIKEVRQERAKVKEQIVVKPDGTRIETRSTSQTKTAQAEGRRDTKLDRDTTASKSESIPAPAPITQYSLGIQTKPGSYREPAEYGISAGRRLLGPVWAEGTYSPKRGFTLGLRVEW